MVSRRGYVPERGDVVWMMFGPQAGREQSGRRPGVVMSSSIYNGKTGMALCCPITSHVKGYPFEVLVPAGLKTSGAILADHIRNIDWKLRRAEYLCKLPDKALEEVAEKILSLLIK
ncbi:MAG: endoribonuclease MazF [Bellilinea sp.]